MIIFTTDAVVKIYAMVVKSLRASFTCVTVVARNVDDVFTFVTVL